MQTTATILYHIYMGVKHKHDLRPKDKKTNRDEAIEAAKQLVTSGQANYISVRESEYEDPIYAFMKGTEIYGN